MDDVSNGLVAKVLQENRILARLPVLVKVPRIAASEPPARLAATWFVPAPRLTATLVPAGVPYTLTLVLDLALSTSLDRLL
jgi:hypothetical protein